jgi:hypothetical protein
MLQKLIPEVGFPWSCRIVGFLCLALCIIANILIRNRLPPLENADTYPDLRIFKSAAFSITTLGVFLIEWGLFVPITYISSYALSQGFSQAFAFQILPIMNVGSFFGRWILQYHHSVCHLEYHSGTMYLAACGKYNRWVCDVCAALWICEWEQCEPDTCVYQPAMSDGELWSLLCDMLYRRFVWLLNRSSNCGEILAHNGGQYWGLMVFVGACYIGALAALVTTRMQSKGWKLGIIY